MKFILLFALTLSAARVLAQQSDALAHPWGVGAFIGRGLPHGLSENDDMFTIWGLRLSPPMPGTNQGYFDATYTSGAGGPVTWQELSTGVSLQQPLESLLLNAGIGFEAIRFTTDLLNGPNIACGYYLLASVMTRITPSILIRFDMITNSQPTTVDMFDLGLQYLF